MKISATMIQTKRNISIVGLVCILAAALLVNKVEAMNLADQYDQSTKQPVALAVVENPELVVRVLDNLLRSILYSASVDTVPSNQNGAQKRGLDLGISRGFSGSQAGKHLMGLSAASFANGPGRR